MTKQADFKRRVRARMAKTGESYTTARAQLLVASSDAPNQHRADALHVTNGDSAARTLLEIEHVDRVLSWRDALHEGPVPETSDDELRRVRAAFLSEDSPEDADSILRSLEARDRELEGARDGDYVLWFEADLYDQLQLAQVLARHRELGVPAERITLICIGEHLGIAHFGGLGELTAEQLERVASTAATSLGDDALEVASDAWQALCRDEPVELERIAKTQSTDLRFVGEAFDRLSREYPSSRDGLSLTERRILAAVAEGAASAGEAFVAAARRETRPFLGDTFAFRTMRRLAAGRTPMLALGDAPMNGKTPIGITESGRAVLGAEADYVELNGVDRWIGGVHLDGDGPNWRWDEGLERIVR
jgi:uncharacterized protein DUF1835